MKNLKILSIIFIILIKIFIVLAKPQRRMPLGAIAEDGVTTLEIDLNDFKQKQQILNQFHISPEEIERRRLKHISNSATTLQPNFHDDPFREIKENRKENIRNQILDVFRNRPNQEDTIHEMAAYPICNQGNENESHWQQDSNITYIFSSTLFEKKSNEFYLDTAVLRLFKLNPDDPEARTTPKPNNCDDIDQQIRVTVSTVQRRSKRGENEDRKKRICNTMMLNVSHTGWVEIDVRRAINIWEKSERQIRSTNGHNINSNNNNSNNNGNSNKPVLVGWLTIEVHDEEERPLKPGLYFEPPKCSQAYPAIPWNFYRLYSWSSDEMEKVPRSPRLDIKLIDNRNYPTHINNHHRIRSRFENHRRSISTNCNHSTVDQQHQSEYSNSQTNYYDSDELTASSLGAITALSSSSSAGTISTTQSAQTTNYETTSEFHRKRHSNHHNHNHHHNNHHQHHQLQQTEQINSDV